MIDSTEDTGTAGTESTEDTGTEGIGYHTAAEEGWFDYHSVAGHSYSSSADDRSCTGCCTGCCTGRSSRSCQWSPS